MPIGLVKTDNGCAARAWKEVSQRKPDDIEALSSLALAYEGAGQPGEARRTLEQLTVLDSKNPAHLLELARLAENGGEHEGALGYLAHARDLQPENAQTHFLIARIEMELELVVEARKSLERALAVDPKNPAYNYAMGFVILSTRDAASASDYFQRFLSAQPGDKKGEYALGVAYYASGNYEGAKDQMHRVEADKANAGGANYFLGCMARRENELEASERYLRRSIQLLPNYAESHTELARTLMLEKRMEEGQQELSRAIQLNPQSFPANEQLLAFYRRTHDQRADQQQEIVKKLDDARSRRVDLMLRTVEFRP